MIDIPLDTNTTTQIEKNFNETGGILHKKLIDRYKVVEVLPKKTDSFEKIFKYADAYGQIRFGFLHKSIPQKKNSAAIGGKIGIVSPSFYNFSFNIAAYISQNLHMVDAAQESYDFLDAKGNSYIYLGLASIDYNSNDLEVKVGRYDVDMPYANTDDIRMSPNSFEGAWENFRYDESFSSQFFYISRWAGFDSQDVDALQSQNEFKKLVVDGFGMAGASLSYRFDQNNELSLWQHYIDKLTAITYAELNGVWYFDTKLHFNYGLQFSHLQELDNSQVQGDVLGFMTMLHTGEIFFPFAYNLVLSDEQNVITDGYGGGPYFTSLDEATIASASEYLRGENIAAYKVGVGYEYKDAVFEYAYGYMRGDVKYLKEHNFILSYNMDNTIVLEMIYTDYKTMDDRMDRFLFRAEYNF